MKNILLLLISAGLLSGCFYQDVTRYDVALSEAACRNNGGVSHIRAYAMTEFAVYCKDRYKDPIGISQIRYGKSDIEKNIIENL